MMISKQELKSALEWLFSSDTGVSSKSICAWMLGVDYCESNSPSDQWDRGRCIRLLQLVPSWVERLDEMKTIDENWEKQIELIKQELTSKD